MKSRNSIFTKNLDLETIKEDESHREISSSLRKRKKKKSTFLSNERELKKSIILRKLKSTASLVEYFTDEDTDIKKRLQLKNSYFYHSHDVNFSLSQYLETFTLHFLYFGILGPFINLYTLFVRKHKNYMSNLLFGRIKSISTYIQLYSWVSTVWLCYIYATKNTGIIDFNTFYVFVISIIVRSSVIAGKYATYPRNKMREIRETFIKEKELGEELMLTGWFSQNCPTVELEMDSTMKRMEIDNTLFKIAFMAPPSDKTKQKLLEIDQHHKGFKAMKKSKRCNKDMTYYDSKNIFAFLILKFDELKSRGIIIWITTFTIVMALLYGFGGGIIRLFFNQTFHGEDLHTIFVYYLFSLSSSLLNFGVFIFFGVGIVDIQRKIFLLRQLGQIISPKKLNNYVEKKYLPTINILDQLTLNTWVELRKLVVDYGRKYFFRHEIFMPVTFLTGLVNLIIAMAIGFYDFSKGDENRKRELIKLQIFLALNFFTQYFMLFDLLFKASAINNQFDEHVSILKKNKQLYKDLLFFKEFYFAEKMNPNKPVYTYDKESLIHEKSTSFVHLKLAREVMDILGDKLEENIEGYLRNIIWVNDACVEELIDEEKFNSLKLLGFKITGNAVTNLIVVFLSVTVTAYEILM